MSHQLPQEEELPRKRVKTSDESAEQNTTTTTTASGISQVEANAVPELDEQGLREAQVGITNFVSPELPGFEGILKKRYELSLFFFLLTRKFAFRIDV